MLLSCHHKLPDLVWFLLFSLSISFNASFDTQYFLRVPHGWQMIESLAVSPVSLKFNHLTSISFGSKYSRMEQVKFVKTAFKKFEMTWSTQPISTLCTLSVSYNSVVSKIICFKNLPVPEGGDSEKFLKGGWSMVQGQVFWKGGGGWHFLYLIFSRFIIFTCRNYSLQKCVMYLKKNVFFCHHNFMKKGHSK